MSAPALRSPSKDIYHLLVVVVTVAVICALYFARVIFIPLALAVLFAFALTPVVKAVERIRIGRAASSWLVVIVCLAGVVGIGWMVANQFAQVVNQLPEYQSNIAEKLNSLHFLKSDTVKNASATMDQISKALVAPATGSSDGSGKRSAVAVAKSRPPLPVEVIQPLSLPLDSVQSALGLLLTFAIVIVFTIFMLVRRDSLRDRFISLVGQKRLSVMTRALDEAGDRVSRYLRTQLAVNASYGLFIGLGLHLIGIPGALLWGVIVGILRFLPYIGPPLGGIMPLFLSLAIFHGWRIPLITLALFVVTELVVSNAIEPLVYGAHTGISPLAILVAAIFWTAVWGPIGLVLSTPLTVCLVVLGRHIPHLGFLPLLLGEEPVLPADARFYQRLLAMDTEEAHEVLESLLEKKSLEEVYDSVLIPALHMAEQDRHRNLLDEASEKFISQSVREMVEELYERNKKPLPAGGDQSAGKSTVPTDVKRFCRVVCVPARDEADEVVSIMLAQSLDRAGHYARWLPLGSMDEVLKKSKAENPDAICISALPPLSVSHLRALYKAVQAQFPHLPIIVGLWNLSGDSNRMVKRFGLVTDSAVVTELSEAIRKIDDAKNLLSANHGDIDLAINQATITAPQI